MTRLQQARTRFELKQVFAGVLNRPDGEHLRLCEVRYIHNGEVEFRFLNEPPFRYPVALDDACLADTSATFICARGRFQLRDPYQDFTREFEQFSNLAHRTFDECRENIHLERELHERRIQLVHMQEHMAPQMEIWRAFEALRQLEHHVRRFHRDEPEPSRHDDMADALAYGLPHSSATEVRMRQERYRPRGHQEQLEAMAQVMRAMELNGLGSARALQYGTSHEAVKRARNLLISHLSAEQCACYELNKYFHVIGCHSKKTYRIKEGRQQNVYELDKKGNLKIGLCFLPGGGLVEGDVMLGQKIALECEEHNALKIANRFPVHGGASNMAAEFLSAFY